MAAEPDEEWQTVEFLPSVTNLVAHRLEPTMPGEAGQFATVIGYLVQVTPDGRRRWTAAVCDWSTGVVVPVRELDTLSYGYVEIHPRIDGHTVCCKAVLDEVPLLQGVRRDRDA